MHPVRRDLLSLIVVNGRPWILVRCVIAGAVFLAVGCFLFPTAISPDELERRIEEHYPGVFETRPYHSWAEAMIDARIRDQNYKMHCDFEIQSYRLEAWAFRRLPMTAVLLMIYLAIELALQRKRAAGGAPAVSAAASPT